MAFPFNSQSVRVLRLAEQEALHFSHEYVGTEHILLGLVREDFGVASTALFTLSVGPGETSRMIERVLSPGPPGERVVVGRLPRTPRAESVLDLAIAEARHLGDGAVGPEHLLLGLARETEGVAAQVLLSLGADHGALREVILRCRVVPEWRTETVMAVARAISAEKAYDRMPLLADALEDAGCCDPLFLEHLRNSTAHGCRAPVCWVLDRLLGAEHDYAGRQPDPDWSDTGQPLRARLWWR